MQTLGLRSCCKETGEAGVGVTVAEGDVHKLVGAGGVLTSTAEAHDGGRCQRFFEWQV